MKRLPEDMESTLASMRDVIRTWDKNFNRFDGDSRSAAAEMKVVLNGLRDEAVWLEGVMAAGINGDNDRPPDVFIHDDGCGAVLDGDGKCPVCNFHPDMQSRTIVKPNMTMPRMPPRQQSDGRLSVVRVEDKLKLEVTTNGKTESATIGEYNAWRVFGMLALLLDIPLPTQVGKAIKFSNKLRMRFE